jgi:adenine C2-methylase RlmN of 23S rRNA A2503 and tRNA A37
LQKELFDEKKKYEESLNFLVIEKYHLINEFNDNRNKKEEFVGLKQVINELKTNYNESIDYFLVQIYIELNYSLRNFYFQTISVL